MRRVLVVTDSNVCLPVDLVRNLGIEVLPITVHLPGADRPDGEDGLLPLVYQALDAEQPVKSSPPSVTEYLRAIEAAAEEAVLVVTPATEFTAMHGHASLACELARRPAVAVDSRTATAGQGLVVLAAARAAARGAPLHEVRRAVEEAAALADVVASVAELQTLWNRGWVPTSTLEDSAAAVDGGGPRTLFRFRSGSVEPLGRLETSELALDALHDRWAKGGGPASADCVVFHAEVPDLAARLLARLGQVSFVSGFSAAMGIHTGRGVLGVAWLPSGQGGGR